MNDSMTKDTGESGTAPTAHLIVPGMGSDHCAGIVSTALKRLNGVAEVRTDIAKHSVDVVFNPDRLEIAALKHAVEAVGKPSRHASGIRCRTVLRCGLHGRLAMETANHHATER